MNSPLRTIPLAACALGALSATAQQAPPLLDRDDPTYLRNRVSVNVQFMFGVSAEVRGMPVAPQAGPIYDDGFVANDVSGNVNGKTWNWGYLYNDQVVGDNLQMHTLDGSPRTGTSQSAEDDFSSGVSLTYGREFKRWAVGKDKERFVILGADANFGTMEVNIPFNNSVAGSVLRTTRNFGLDGVVPPTAPYAGTFDGPGPVIDSTPNSTTTDTAAAVSTLESRVRSLIYGLQLGPFIEVPLMNKFDLQVRAGVAMMYSSADIEFVERTYIADVHTGGAPLPLSATYSNGEFMFGYYAQALFAYEFNYQFRAYVGAAMQGLGSNTINGPGLQATVKADSTYGFVLGVQMLF